MMKSIALLLLVIPVVISGCTPPNMSSDQQNDRKISIEKPDVPSAEKLISMALDKSWPAEARRNYANQAVNLYPNTPWAEKATSIITDIDKELIGSQWTYLSDTDSMTGKKSYSATVTSSNSFNFDFPYQGEQNAKLTLRNHDRHGKDVIFFIDKGQILCHTYNCRVQMRIDDKAPIALTGTEPADNSTEAVFIPAYSRLIRDLPKAKTLRVEVLIFQHGPLVAEFDVSGFDPKRLQAAAQ